MSLVKWGVYIGGVAAAAVVGYNIKPKIQEKLKNEGLDNCSSRALSYFGTTSVGLFAGGVAKGCWTRTLDGTKVGMMLGGSAALAGAVYSEDNRACTAAAVTILVLGIMPKG